MFYKLLEQINYLKNIFSMVRIRMIRLSEKRLFIFSYYRSEIVIFVATARKIGISRECRAGAREADFSRAEKFTLPHSCGKVNFSHVLIPYLTFIKKKLL